jgi:hypothetical protein
MGIKCVKKCNSWNKIYKERERDVQVALRKFKMKCGVSTVQMKWR